MCIHGGHPEEVSSLTSIAVVSVSAPAVRDTVAYARGLKRRGIADIDFSIFYFSGERDNSRVDLEEMKSKLRTSDLCVLDLMGIREDAESAVYDAMADCRSEHIIIGRTGGLTQKLGKYDEKRFRANPEDGQAIKDFCEYFTRCEENDIESAFDMVLKGYFGHTELPDPEPVDSVKGVFIREPTNGRIYRTRAEFLEDFPPEHGDDVALFYTSHNYPYDSNAVMSELVTGLRGFCDVTPIAFNGFSPERMDDLKALMPGRTAVMVSVSPFRFIAGPMGGSTKEAMQLLRDTDAAFLRPFFISRATREEWMERRSGLRVPEFMLNVFLPELDGGTCTFPLGTCEEVETVEEYNLVLSEITAVPDRMEKFLNKVRGLIRLRNLDNSEKKVAIVGYNYPPGEGNLFGGSFLDTFGSLGNILERLRSEGYDIGDLPTDRLKDEFLEGGILNGGDWTTPSESAAIRFGGSREHPASVTDEWGPAPGDVLADSRGYRIPGVVHGNIFIGLQPPRSLTPGEDVSKEYHDPYRPPHHQYLAFYEWIMDEFRADAVVHIGTHGTVEFLPGKEVAMSGECFPDIAVGDIPHFYLYYMGNPSEAVLAKRRTHAGLISYMSPPYVRSDLYGDLSELEGLIAEYRESQFVDAGRSQNVLEQITARAGEMRLPTGIDDLEHELDDMRMSLIPKGLHRIGEPFSGEEAEEFAIQGMRFPHESCRPLWKLLEERGYDDPEERAEGMYRAYNRGTVPEEFRNDRNVMASLDYEKRVSEQATQCHEIDGLLASLDGRFVDVKTGGDFLRTPEIIPTGYNIVQFDPNKVPTEAAFERGRQAAENTIAMYLEDHGEYPESVAMVMWGLEVSRSQGASIGQILTYLGLRMVDTAGPFEKRFEVIPAEELGRPRVDVTVSICGFFRDMFSNLVDGLNRIFGIVDGLDEPDEVNPFRKHTRDNYGKLIDEGYSKEDARDLSLCRLFGPGEGLYGTGMTGVVNGSAWEDEEDLADVFEDSMRHAYSMKHRGYDAKGLLRNNHRNVDVVSQIRDNVEYELIDLDHYYEFFGGLSKTVEVARGSKAAMYITDNTGPVLKTQDVRTSIEHGIRTRLLNPKWIDGMLETDYHGAQQINSRFENVLGLAATTGAVESSVFSDMEECYITDEVMRRRIRENNNWALIDMINRLFEANKRGYWSATEEELEVLRQAYLESEETAEEESDRD